ncbi:MAG: hypothetical protein K2F77_06715, partial [Muribaculaceae bacterium]|nr:hypothetical protein [Muribaculaceae bacterium]
YPILCLLIAAASISARARDVAVVLRVDETNEKITKFTPRLTDPADSHTIATATLNSADSIFVFAGMPDSLHAVVSYEADGDMLTQELDAQSDTTTIYVPAFYLKSPKQLKELTVTASDRSLGVGKETYLPTAANKRISADGLALIENSGIASLLVDPINGNIRKADGAAVSTFIDYMPASRTDVQNIRTEDVKRVEVYDFPSDPRFGGAQHVVNFVMVKYELGGYSKISAQQQTIVNSGGYRAVSKFAYKKMTYDVGVDYIYTRNRHTGANSSSSYDFPDRHVETDLLTESSLTYQKNTAALLRAVYQTKKLQISNTVSFMQLRSPDNKSVAAENFSDALYHSGSRTSRTDMNNRSVNWVGNYQFDLGSTTLVVNPSASYASNRYDYLYSAAETDIANFSREKAWSASLKLNVSKSFGKHSLLAVLHGDAEGNNIDYSGATASFQRGRDYYAGAYLQGGLNFGSISLVPLAHVTVYNHRINSASDTQVVPNFYLYADWMLNAKNRLSLIGMYYQSVLSQSSRTDHLQHQNQIDAIAGNSRIRPVDNGQITLTYTSLPISQLSVKAFVVYDHANGPTAFEYLPNVFEGRNIMVRRYVNAKLSQDLGYGLTLTSRLLDNALDFNVRLIGQTQRVQGPYSASGTSFIGVFSATYRLADFYVSAMYQTGQKQITPTGTERYPQYYSLTAGWGNGNWNISAKAICPFQKSYVASTHTISTSGYSSIRTDMSPDLRQHFLFSASYSFSYGRKKVDTYVDTNISGGVESQILK